MSRKMIARKVREGEGTITDIYLIDGRIDQSFKAARDQLAHLLLNLRKLLQQRLADKISQNVFVHTGPRGFQAFRLEVEREDIIKTERFAMKSLVVDPFLTAKNAFLDKLNADEDELDDVGAFKWEITV